MPGGTDANEPQSAGIEACILSLSEVEAWQEKLTVRKGLMKAAVDKSDGD
jgi:hypothetical protein